MARYKPCKRCGGKGIKYVPKIVRGRRVRVPETCKACGGNGKMWVK